MKPPNNFDPSDDITPLSARDNKTAMLIVLVLAGLALIGVLSVVIPKRSSRIISTQERDARAVEMAMGDYWRAKGHLPSGVRELRDQHYLPADFALDPTKDGEKTAYDDFYVPRAPDDSDDLPVLLLPAANGQGARQIFKGRYTREFLTQPAALQNVINATVQPLGFPPTAAYAGMKLGGGDRIRTGPQGAATIRFADGSKAELRADSDLTVLQSFLLNTTEKPLYTVVREALGDITFRVHHGSKFDVVTPVATAGAHGTAFRIRVWKAEKGSDPYRGSLQVSEGKVVVSTPRGRRSFSGAKPMLRPISLDERSPLPLAPKPVLVSKPVEKLKPVENAKPAKRQSRPKTEKKEGEIRERKQNKSAKPKKKKIKKSKAERHHYVKTKRKHKREKNEARERERKKDEEREHDESDDDD